MQIEVRKSEAKVEREYPYVGESSDKKLKVLFYEKEKGIAIESYLELPKPFTYSDKWEEERFTPIGKVKKLIIETE